MTLCFVVFRAPSCLSSTSSSRSSASFPHLHSFDSRPFLLLSLTPCSSCFWHFSSSSFVLICVFSPSSSCPSVSFPHLHAFDSRPFLLLLLLLSSFGSFLRRFFSSSFFFLSLPFILQHRFLISILLLPIVWFSFVFASFCSSAGFLNLLPPLFCFVLFFFFLMSFSIFLSSLSSYHHSSFSFLFSSST